jgi:bacterioferritin
LTSEYRADRQRVVDVLNEVLATELVCVLRYKRHHFTASGAGALQVAAEFLAHAVEEQAHADLVAARIVQLQGEPDFDPDTLTKRSHSQYISGRSLREMISEDLVAERVAIASYNEIIRWLADDDITTRRLMETILASEEEHADDMLLLLGAEPSHN